MIAGNAIDRMKQYSHTELTALAEEYFATLNDSDRSDTSERDGEA